MDGRLSYLAHGCESRSLGVENRPVRSKDVFCAQPDGNGVGYLTTPLMLINGAQREWGTVRNECAVGEHRIK